jgi:hypothetical protein
MGQTNVQNGEQVVDSTATPLITPTTETQSTKFYEVAPKRNRIRAVAEAGSNVVKGVAEAGSNVVKGVAERGGSVVKGVAEAGSNVVKGVAERGGSVAEAVAERGGSVVHAVAERGGKVAEVVGEKTGLTKVPSFVSQRYHDLLGTHEVDALQVARLMELVAAAGQADVAQGLIGGEGYVAWLASLSEEQRAHAYRAIAAFCAAEGVDLDWLLSEPGIPDAEVRAGLVRAVQLAALAQWQAARVQAQLAALAAYRAWQKAPTSKEQWPTTQKLYLRLSESGAIPAPAPETLLLDESERQAYVARMVAAAASTHSRMVMDLLKPVSV